MNELKRIERLAGRMPEEFWLRPLKTWYKSHSLQSNSKAQSRDTWAIPSLRRTDDDARREDRQQGRCLRQ